VLFICHNSSSSHFTPIGQVPLTKNCGLSRFVDVKKIP